MSYNRFFSYFSIVLGEQLHHLNSCKYHFVCFFLLGVIVCIGEDCLPHWISTGEKMAVVGVVWNILSSRRLLSLMELSMVSFNGKLFWGIGSGKRSFLSFGKYLFLYILLSWRIRYLFSSFPSKKCFPEFLALLFIFSLLSKTTSLSTTYVESFTYGLTDQQGIFFSISALWVDFFL